jgi:hypothetical protein
MGWSSHGQVAELAAAASKCGCDDDRRRVTGAAGHGKFDPWRTSWVTVAIRTATADPNFWGQLTSPQWNCWPDKGWNIRTKKTVSWQLLIHCISCCRDDNLPDPHLISAPWHSTRLKWDGETAAQPLHGDRFFGFVAVYCCQYADAFGCLRDWFLCGGLGAIKMKTPFSFGKLNSTRKQSRLFLRF